jgi:hypothetical protein
VPKGSSADADGYIKPGEYDDALEIDLSNATWKAYLYLKHDNQFLFVFIDHVSDTFHHPVGYDNGWVVIDTLGDGGDAPKEDDYMFHSSGHHVYLGDGPAERRIENGDWEELIGHFGTSTIPDLKDRAESVKSYKASGPGAFGLSGNSMTPHAIFEIQIPIRGWEFEQASWTVGFCAAASSPGTSEDLCAKVAWPSSAYPAYTEDFYAGGITDPGPPIQSDPQEGSFPPPSTWGTLTLENVGDPETGQYNYLPYLPYIVGGIVVAVIIIGTVAILLRRKRR